MNSFLSWVGGKNYLKKEIVSRFPEKYEKYIEVFGGAAWVLFYKEKSEYEVYNDLNSDLVNLFKCVKFHFPELKRELSGGLNSRQLFNEMRESCNFTGLTDIQRAARFFMLIKTSYGSKGENFGCVKKNINIMVDYLDRVQERLCNVVIENMSFEKIIERYDKKDVLFYLDPPYYGTEKYYQIQFSEENHIRLAEMLKNVEGKFILSYNDCEYVRELYSQFNIEVVERFNNLSARYTVKERKYKELIIKNY